MLELKTITSEGSMIKYPFVEDREKAKKIDNQGIND